MKFSFVIPSKDLKLVLKLVRCFGTPIKRIIIAGGGHVGKRLALALERGSHVKVIEKNLSHTEKVPTRG